MDTSTLVATIDALDYKKLGNIAWRAEVESFKVPWREYLRQTHASDLNTAQAQLVYERAWDEAHSAGYHEVENAYIELAAFATSLINA